jgi:hypothetical protein
VLLSLYVLTEMAIQRAAAGGCRMGSEEVLAAAEGAASAFGLEEGLAVVPAWVREER